MNNDMALLDKPLTVSEINHLIGETLKQGFYNLSVTGEISGFTPSSSGHWYFDIKDNKSKISAVMWKTSQFRMTTRPKNGDRIVARGNISVYEPRGTYQFVCQNIENEGIGNILLELEKLKAFYQERGYFDQKKPIPKYPKTVGVVTASTGAAIQDILQITQRRAPSMNIIVLPSLVQGETAAREIALRIKQANMFNMCDVLIVGRGGGSLEDLLSFSEADVIEAIHESEIPVISAVGHEVDWAISDLVADLRAPTPSAAAELVTEGYFTKANELKQINDNLNMIMRSLVYKADNRIVKLDYLKGLLRHKTNVRIPSTSDLFTILDKKINSAEIKLGYISEKPFDVINLKLAAAERKINDKKISISSSFEKRFNMLDSKLNTLSAEIIVLNPLSILKRGYAVVEKTNKKIVKDSKDVEVNEELNIRLYNDNIKVVVKGDKK